MSRASYAQVIDRVGSLLMNAHNSKITNSLESDHRHNLYLPTREIAPGSQGGNLQTSLQLNRKGTETPEAVKIAS
jgi:hypothetical protein